MAKILLVRPPTILPRNYITSGQGCPPIGVAYLASALAPAGHTVDVIDAFGEEVNQFTPTQDDTLLINGLTAEEIVKRIPNDVEIIGVSCMFSNEWLYYKETIQAIYKKFPVPIICGGEHITADAEFAMRSCPEIRYCVLGEGEEAAVELVDAIVNQKPLENVTGIAFIATDGVFCKTPARKRIKNLEEIPLPEWNAIPLENYFVNELGMSSVRGRNMPMIASRGCPYQCTFCSNPYMWTNRWFAREVNHVIDEMKMYVAKYRVNHFEFYDLTTIVQKKWIVDFANRLIEEKMNITWSLPSGTRSEALDNEVVSLLRRSGCLYLTYAPESGSPATLKRIKKQIDPAKMLQSMRWSVKHGLLIKANMIIGFPGQTLKEVWESFWFIVRMAWVGVQDVCVFPFVPYPGSELFFQLVGSGKIKREGGEYERFLSGSVYTEISGMRSWSEYITDRQIKFLTLGGMALFYAVQFLLRPWRFVQILYRMVTDQPITILEKALDGILKNIFKGRKRKVHLLVPKVNPT